MFPEKFHRRSLRPLFADLIGKHDPRTNGQLGKLSIQHTVSMEIYFLRHRLIEEIQIHL